MTKPKDLRRRVREVLEKIPEKKLPKPKEHWYNEGKSCDVITHEPDLDTATDSILEAVREIVPKKLRFDINKYVSHRGIVGHNKCIDEITKRIT